MTTRRADERGTVTAFVVVFSFALLSVAGLVIDGGLVLAARQSAFNEADAAARAAAQAVDIDALRATGEVRLVPAAAERFAAAQLPAERDATVHVDGATATVQVRLEQRLTILGLAGLGPVEIRAESQARGIRGVRTGGD